MSREGVAWAKVRKCHWEIMVLQGLLPSVTVRWVIWTNPPAEDNYSPQIQSKKSSS